MHAPDSQRRILSAVACEVLARRIVHQSPGDKIIPIMTTRYRVRESDGDISEASSALEVSIDNHWYVFPSSGCSDHLTCMFSIIFLSSSEAEHGQYIQVAAS
jgi:hypothetical protein